MEGLEAADELGRRPLPEIIATILSDFGVTELDAVAGAPQFAGADIAALYDYAAGLATSRQAGIERGRPADGGAAGGTRRNGAMGRRDP